MYREFLSLRLDRTVVFFIRREYRFQCTKSRTRVFDGAEGMYTPPPPDQISEYGLRAGEAGRGLEC